MAIDREKILQRRKELPLWLSVILNIIGWIITVALILLAAICIWSGVDRATDYEAPIFGYRFSVVVSDSMAMVNEANEEELEGYDNQFSRNDVLVCSTDFDYDSIELYDVVLVKIDDELYCHRVVRKETIGEYELIYTRGDANTALDAAVTVDQIIGKMVGIIPDVGAVVLYIQSGWGLLAISLVIICIVIGCCIGSAYNSRHRYRAYSFPVESGELAISPIVTKMGEHPRDRAEVDEEDYAI